jgi:hypothetical protein
VLILSSLSSEFVKVPVRAEENGAVVNPTADVVELAFAPGLTEPAGTAWNVAEWETAGADYFARIVVGPLGVVLAEGDWGVWVRVTDTPERPVHRAGTLTIT